MRWWPLFYNKQKINIVPIVSESADIVWLILAQGNSAFVRVWLLLTGICCSPKAKVCQVGCTTSGQSMCVGGWSCTERAFYVGDPAECLLACFSSFTSVLASGSVAYCSLMALSACVIQGTIFAYGHTFLLHTQLAYSNWTENLTQTQDCYWCTDSCLILDFCVNLNVYLYIFFL